MIAIFTVIISFLTAIIGFFHSHAAQERGRSILGLTPIGFCLLILAFCGMVFGVTLAVQDYLSSKELKAKEELRDQMLKGIYAQVVGYRDIAQDPNSMQLYGQILNRIEAATTLARESDFSMSDLSFSNFKHGRFSNANFEGALFDGANFKGADLSKAIFDTNTRLPK